MGAPRIGSRIVKLLTGKSGSATGSTEKANDATWGDRLDSVQELPSTSTIAGATAPTLTSSERSTPSASTTMPSSWPPILVRDYSGQTIPLDRLSPSHREKLQRVAAGYGLDEQQMVNRAVIRLTAGPGNWASQSVETALIFYLDNFVI